MQLASAYIKSHFSGKIFDIISSIADEKGLECYAIGGYVREVVLHRKATDIDNETVGKEIEHDEDVQLIRGRQARLSDF